MDNGIFTSAYAPSIRYYAAMLKCGTVSIDTQEAHLKAPWESHHCRIVGANGVQALTIPLVKPKYGEATPISELMISEHGDWRRVHWGAIFSAYGKSPFFEYIADDLSQVYNGSQKYLYEFNSQLQDVIISFLDLPINTVPASQSSNAIDYRGNIGGKKEDNHTDMHNVEYWQVWKERYGFIPDLSILDLLMNTGRESIFVLNDMINPKRSLDRKGDVF